MVPQTGPLLQSGRRERRVTRGFTLIELFFFLILVMCVIEGGRLAHGRMGGKLWWLLGGLIGAVVWFAGGMALSLMIDLAFQGVPRLPRCQTGRCRGPRLLARDHGDYETVKFGDDYVHVCRCGDRYRRRGKRFVKVSDDGTETPYLRWRSFRGWFPDQ